MKWLLQKVVAASVLLAASVILGACGGGDSSPSSVIEVITVKKALQGPSETRVSDTVALLTNSGVSVVAKKCGILKFAPDNQGTGVIISALLADISTKDLPTAQALGFSLFSPADVFPDGNFAC